MPSMTEIATKYGYDDTLTVIEDVSDDKLVSYSKIMSVKDARSFERELDDNCIIGWTVLPLLNEGQEYQYMYGWWESISDEH